MILELFAVAWALLTGLVMSGMMNPAGEEATDDA